jgi:cation:H+ antiporter
MLTTVILFVAGLVMLILGAEVLVRGASRMALQWGISPLVVGLTVVSIGTGSPEIAVGLQSALTGQTDLAVGNVVGSNIFNVLAVLGVSALFAPLAISRQIIRSEVPVMIAASLLVLLIGWDGAISRIDGGLLLVLMVAYTLWLLRQSKSASPADHNLNLARATNGRWIYRLQQPALIVIGLLLLLVGADRLVSSAIAFAQAFGVSETVIGLTIVAAGTSLPELVTSTLAAIRGKREIAVGNAIGSNIFNLLGVLGLSAVFAPAGLPVSEQVWAFDLPVMLAVAVACLPVFINGLRIARWEGALFFGYYVAYTVFLVLTANQSPAAPVFGRFMLVFVIPITVVTFAVVLFQLSKSKRNSQATAQQEQQF